MTLSPNHRTALLSGLLFLSLALNAWLLAFGFGTSRHHMPPPAFERGNMLRGLADQTRDLSPELRARIEEKVKASQAEMKSAIDDIRAQKEVLRAMMAEEQPDAEKLRASFAELRRRTARAQEVAHDTIIAVVPDLPPQKRPFVHRPDMKFDMKRDR